jgi:hypothetical protein
VQHDTLHTTDTMHVVCIDELGAPTQSGPCAIFGVAGGRVAQPQGDRTHAMLMDVRRPAAHGMRHVAAGGAPCGDPRHLICEMSTIISKRCPSWLKTRALIP